MENISNATRAFVLVREFNAPRELFFNVCTQPEHLIKWWGPKDSKLNAKTIDIREGGKFHYEFTYSNGPTLWGLLSYIEITPYDRIVFTTSFADEKTNPVKAPMAAGFPLVIKNTWTLAEKNGKTTLTMEVVPVDASPNEVEFFAGMFGSMEQGNNGMLDQLDDYLTTLK
ncbi:MAG TPA: SRPBCC domain-containing protein [Flavobacteriales bacterium]|nr:SRPBCC domain-containing protein [Flavobacteriales bacterium]